MLAYLVIIVGVYGNIQSLVRNKPSFIEWIFFRMTKGNEFVVLFKVRKIKRGSPAYGFQCGVSCPFKSFSKRRQFLFSRNFIKAANPYIDRMDFPATNESNNLIPYFFKLQTSLNNVRMIFCHLYYIRVVEKIGGMQHIHVEYMAFNPLTAINKPSQGTELTIYLDAKCVFHCMH